MENDHTEYKNNDDEDFIDYLFSSPPQSKGSIKLDLGPPNNGKPLNKHIYEQLLQIFIDGLKYFYGENDKLDITKIDVNNIFIMKEYFLSFNIDLNFIIYNKDNYVAKPYIYGNMELEKKSKKINDYYFQIEFKKENKDIIYRISFDFA